MDLIFDKVADFLSRARGFFTVHVMMVIGYYTLPTDIFTMSLSVLAISLAGFLLVSGLKGQLAIHLKLDELIRTSKAQNKVIGAEHQDIKEVEESLKTIEKASEQKD